MRTIKAYFLVFIIYFVVDCSYQFIFGIDFSSQQYKEAGITDVLANPPQHIWLFFVFFVLITTANVELAVKPALQKDNIKLAFKNSTIVGITAYGTLATCITWTITDFPLIMTLEILLEGLVFSTVSSVLSTQILSKKKHKA